MLKFGLAGIGLAVASPWIAATYVTIQGVAAQLQAVTATIGTIGQ